MNPELLNGQAHDAIHVDAFAKTRNAKISGPKRRGGGGGGGGH